MILYINNDYNIIIFYFFLLIIINNFILLITILLKKIYFNAIKIYASLIVELHIVMRNYVA